GQRVDNADLTPANEANTEFTVSLKPISEGTYLVSWRVLSSVDGHTTSGTFPFGVGVGELSAEAGSVSSSATQPTPFSIGGRWLTLTGIVLLLGIFTFQLFVWQPLIGAVRLDEHEGRMTTIFLRRSLWFAVLCVGLIGVGLGLTFVSQNSQFDLLSGEYARIWLGTQFGSMWFVRFGLTLVTAVYLLYLFRLGTGIPVWLWWAGVALASGLSLTVSLVSHSAALTAEDALLALIVDYAHMLAAGVWVGGLLQLVLALWLVRRLTAKSRAWLNWGAVLNFAAAAATSVGVLLLSGGYLAWKHINSWTLLFGTAYGLTLVAKLGLIFPTLGIAVANLLVIKPRLEQALNDPETPASQRWYGRLNSLTIIEAGFAVMVLAAAAYLTDLQRGLDAPLLTNDPGKVLFEEQVDDLSVVLGLEPALVGQNTFDVYLQDKNGRPVEDAEEVFLRFTFLGQSMGVSTAEATHLGQGRYQAEGGYISLVGGWQVEVVIRRPGAFDTFAPFRMEAGL
ncbi:MAG: CopD family protein, partial [Anaerolineae bacterium]|nr:CopD family protein [Anaerolineae bacterium]